MRFFPCAIVFLALSLAAQEGYGMDPTLGEARLDIMGGNKADAARTWAAWLDANAGLPAAPLMFQRYFDIEPSFPALIENARKFVKNARKGASLSESLVQAARLFEVAGLAVDEPAETSDSNGGRSKRIVN